MRFIEKIAGKFYDNKAAIFLFRKLYRSLYSNKINRLRKEKFDKNANNLFNEFDSVLKEIGCEYWLTFGTLLGAIREKKFISHDLDIDVGVFGVEYKDKILKYLTNRGFKRIRYITINGIPEAYEETYVFWGVSIDIFYFSQTEPNYIYCYDFVNKSNFVDKDKYKILNGFVPRKITFPFSGLMKYTFLGLEVNIPLNFNEYLAAHYGETYMIPDPTWNTLSSPIAEVVEGKVGVEHH